MNNIWNYWPNMRGNNTNNIKFVGQNTYIIVYYAVNYYNIDLFYKTY